MTTRNIVPRATGEGSLGTNAKKWGDVYANNVHGALTGNATSATSATNDADGNNIVSTYAPKESPSLTGDPTAPTPTVNNNSTRLATTEYVVNDLKRNTWLVSDTFAEIIPNGADLDSYLTAGTYKTTSASATDSLSNCPVSGVAFKLIVQYNGYSLVSYSGIQILITSLRRVYVRGYDGASGSGSWGSWKHIAFVEDVLPLTGGTLAGDITISKYTSSYRAKSTYTRGDSISVQRAIGYFSFLDANENLLGGTSLAINTDKTAMITIAANRIDGTSYYVALQTPQTGNPAFRGRNDNDYNLGMAAFRWKQLYAGTTTISTSDERLKDNIVAIPDEVLDAWGEVNWYQYQFKDSIEEKGETKARLHTGAIAQRIESVFNAHGLDANKYGLLCYDSWKAEPAERDEDGNVVQEARPAGNRYSLRYEEALCMEAAYQRRRADRLEQRLNAIEQRLSALEE